MEEPQPIETPQPKVRNLGPVPVYNCHVYLSRSAEGGEIAVRGATLPEVQATGRTEREALQNIVRRFKEVIVAYNDRGEKIPWLEQPLPPAAGETQRFVPLHL